jgi:hypothetical protein
LLSLKKKSSYAATVDLPDPHPVILSHRRLGQPLATPWAACYPVSICLARLGRVEVEAQHPLVHLAHHRSELVSTGLTRRYHRLAHLPVSTRLAADRCCWCYRRPQTKAEAVSRNPPPDVITCKRPLRPHAPTPVMLARLGTKVMYRKMQSACTLRAILCFLAQSTPRN